MGIVGRLVKTLAPQRGGHLSDDTTYGTGVWRQHRDRFNRAVDRFYVTAVGLSHDAAATSDTAATPDTAVQQAAQRIAELTHTLNDAAHTVDQIAARLHARVPVDGQTIPAGVRAQVGQVPQLLSRAAGKVAEAGQAAAMVRTQVRGNTSLTGVDAAARYVGDAAELVRRAQSIAFAMSSSVSPK